RDPGAAGLQPPGLQPQMAELAQLLSARFTVFSYDRRGRGESGDTLPYAVEREIEDLDGLITEAGGSAFVYGMSSGAALAMEAAHRGLAIRGLAIFEAPFLRGHSGPPHPPDYLALRTQLTSPGRRGDGVEYFMTGAAGAPAEMVAQMSGGRVAGVRDGGAHAGLRRHDHGGPVADRL